MAKLYFYYSAMNAGKSTMLLQSHHNYEERGMNAISYAYEPLKHKVAKIRSRIGIERSAYPYSNDLNFYKDVTKSIKHNYAPKCVFVDEAQFLTKKQVDQLSDIVDQLGIPVLAYGIRTDFKGNLFSGSKRLLAIADELIEIKTICACGSKATMNIKINEKGEVLKDGAQIELGGNDKYVSVCRRHFNEIKAHSQSLNKLVNLFPSSIKT